MVSNAQHIYNLMVLQWLMMLAMVCPHHINTPS